MLLSAVYEPVIERALLEDLSGGDLTTEATIDPNTRARAVAAARHPLVVCGGDVFCAVFRRVDPTLVFERSQPDGARAATGSAIWRVEGSARSILMAERVALNFAQRMSGIATLTRAYVDAVPPDCTTRITDTRKTTPGLRALERYAVRAGGGHNHRDTLGSAVLIKDNHIVAAGGIAAAVQSARRRAPHTSRLEVEVDGLDQLDEALGAGADIIMLDNFSLQDVRAAVQRVRGRALLEVSGGVTLDRVADVARAGIDVISVGALTHSAPSADIGLDMQAHP